jgi:hypothetical protein
MPRPYGPVEVIRGTASRGLNASTLLNQEVLKFLVLSSNGNVDIQSRNIPSVMDPEGVALEARLRCSNCGAIKAFDISVFSSQNQLMEELKWAADHKHESRKGIPYTYTPCVIPSGDRKLKIVQ